MQSLPPDAAKIGCRTALLCCSYIVATTLAVETGCGTPTNKYAAVVTGTVTVAGELAKNGTVTFHPVEKGGKIAIGRIYHDGSFSLRTGQGNLKESDGGTVVPGDYTVTVSIRNESGEKKTLGEGGPPIPGPSLIAAKYAREESSPLKCKVSVGENVLTFDLDRAAPGEEQPMEETATMVGEGGTQSTDAAAPASAELGQSPQNGMREKGAPQ